MPIGTFLNGGTASQLRGLAWLSLSSSGRVGALTSTDDAGGGATQRWTYSSIVGVPCRVDPISSAGDDETIVAGRLSDRSTHLITVPAGTNVDTANRFLFDSGEIFEVTALRERTAESIRIFEAVEVS